MNKARIIKSIFNPKPLNIRIREQHGLNDAFKLIYILPNERQMLFTTSLGCVLFPLIVSTGVFLLITEFTGRSKFVESYQSPKSFFAFVIIWFGIMLFMTFRIRSTTVFRIYHNPDEKKFILFRPGRGVLSLVREDFTPKDFLLRDDPRAQQLESRLMYFVTKFHGNVFINKKLRQINLEQFITDNTAIKLMGKSVANIRNRSG